MSLSLLQRFRPSHAGLASPAPRRPRPSARRRVLAIDDLESRLVMSAVPGVSPVVPPAHVDGHSQERVDVHAPKNDGAHAQQGQSVDATASPNLLGFKVDSIGVGTIAKDATGAITGLVANVSLGNVTAQVPLTLSTSGVASAITPMATTGKAAPTSSVLSLHLAPINLDLLGLDVKTSNICLNVTAQKGGGLLGNLLYDVNNLASGGLSGSQLSSLTGTLTHLLNGALSAVTSQGTATVSTGTAAASAAATSPTQILDLSLGPVNLNLLGLHVALDNCAGGPVTVDVSAIPSTQAGGGLLGNLLIGVDGLLGGLTGPTLTGVEGLLTKDLRMLI